MKLIIKLLAKLDEFYPVPADDKVEEQLEEDIKNLFHDIDGIEIKKLKVEKQR